MPYRLGFLGAGKVARHHARAARVLGATVTIACTRDINSPNWAPFCEEAPTATQMTDGEALLADSRVDAIVACLDWKTLPQWLNRLLELDKPVLLEKPIGLDLQSTRTLASRARSTRCLKMVGYNRRFYKPVQRLMDRISRGGLKAADVVISETIESHAERHGRDVIPHLLAFASAHVLDLMLYLFGPLEPVAMSAYAETGHAAPFVSYNGVLRTEAGVPVSLALNADDPTPAGIRCRFDDGSTWHLAPLEALTVYQGTEVIPESGTQNIRRYMPKVVETTTVDGDGKPGFKEQMAAFLSGEPGPAATIEDGIRVLEVIDMIEKSATHWTDWTTGRQVAGGRH